MASGFFCKVPDYGFIDTALILTEKGKTVAAAIWNEVVNPPAPKNLWHDEELVRLALFLERQGWISHWVTEQEIKHGSSGERFFQERVRATKIPDLIVAWRTSPTPTLWAIELERTRKEFTRYYEMVGAYKGISNIESVLVIVAANSIETNIKKAQTKMSYPQEQRPMFFATMNQVIEDPMSCELRQGPNRMALGKFAKALTGIGGMDEPLNGKALGNITRNNVSSLKRAI